MITVQTGDSSGAQQVSGPYGNEASDIVLHSAGGQGRRLLCSVRFLPQPSRNRPERFLPAPF